MIDSRQGKLRPMHAADGPVLIAYDGSAAARRAVQAAAKLLRRSRVLVVTVWEAGLAYATAAMPPDGMMMAPLVEPGVALETDRALHQHADTVSRGGAELARSLGLDAEPLAVPDEGDVAHTILRVASERQAAAIVVGSRGLSGLRARLEGSTSKGLLKHASCPVIVVHEPDQAID
jgi:nucleotide-binding universal stress UspA family protein